MTHLVAHVPDVRAAINSAKAKALRIAESHTLLLCLLLYVLATAWRNKTFMLEGRFWAEEGRIFFPALYRASLRDVLSYQFNGHLELFTNLTVWLGSKAPIRYAPLLANYVALAFQILPIWLLTKLRHDLELSAFRCIVLVGLIASIPPAAEVSMNAINLHFHFTLLAALILVVDTSKLGSWMPTRTLLLCAGLSGIPTNFLIPCFAAKAAVFRTRSNLEHFLLLTATGAVQLGFLVHNEFAMGDRAISFDGICVMCTYVSQVVLAPALGTSAFARVSQSLVAMASGAREGLVLAAIACVLSSLVLLDSLRKKTPAQRALVIVSMYLGACMAITSGGDKLLVVAGTGARYFYAPLALLLIGIIAGLTRRHVVCLMFLAMVLHYVPANLTWQDGGPSWRMVLDTAGPCGDLLPHNDCVAIWPSDWWMPLPPY